MTSQAQLKTNFLVNVLITDSCWLWQGATRGKGYGAFRIGNKLLNAHRAAWFIFKGDPKELHVLHTCDNRLCVKIDHLFLGTNQDNVVDKYKKGRQSNAWIIARAIQQRNKTHCPKGHLYSGDNLYITPNNKRDCRTCRRLAQDRRKLKLKEILL